MSDNLNPHPLTCKDCGKKSLEVNKVKKYNVNLCVPCFIQRSIQNSG
jgi:hypothetical protein